MNPLEISIAGALGVVGLALLTAAAVRARHRRRSVAVEVSPRSGWDQAPDLEEDPIVAAIGIGDGAKRTQTRR